MKSKIRLWFTKLTNFVKEYFTTIDVYVNTSFHMQYVFDDGNSVTMQKNTRSNAIVIYMVVDGVTSKSFTTNQFMHAYDHFQLLINTYQS